LKTDHRSSAAVPGEPVPEVTWFKNKKKLKKSKRTKMSTQAETGVCTLEISEATVDDSGEYTAQLDNNVQLQPTILLFQRAFFF